MLKDGRRDDGCRSHWYTNSSPRSLRLRPAKKASAIFTTGKNLACLKFYVLYIYGPSHTDKWNKDVIGHGIF